MTVELLTEHCLEFLSLTGGCTGSPESTLVKMSNCWKSRAAAHMYASIVVKWRLCPYAIRVSTDKNLIYHMTSRLGVK